MRVLAGDAVIVRVRNPGPPTGTVEAYIELQETGREEPTPAYFTATVPAGLSNVLTIPLTGGELTGVSVRASVGPIGHAAVKVWVYLRRRGAAGSGIMLLLASGHTNTDDWVSWTPSGIIAPEHPPTKHAVNPTQTNPVTLEYSVPTGCAARVTGFTLNASIAAGTEQSVVVVEYIFAGLVVAASQSTQLLQRPSSPTVRGSIAPLQFPANAGYVVVPLPASYITQNGIVRVRIDNPNPGDTLTSNAFGVELIAVS